MSTAFGIREAMNSILSGCSSSLSVAVQSQDSKAKTPSSTSSSSASSSSSQHNPSTILVAVDASRGISDYALRWAAANVVLPGDCLTLLAIFPKSHHHRTGWRSWGFPKLAGECASMECSHSAKDDAEDSIGDACKRLVHKLCDSNKIHVKVKVVAAAGVTRGVVALEAKKLGATWIVLDRHLKKEGKCCASGSTCNVVLVNQIGFRILCLNLRDDVGSIEKSRMPPSFPSAATILGLGLPQQQKHNEQCKKRVAFREEESDEAEAETPFTATERGSSGTSSSSSTGCSEHEQLQAKSHSSGLSLIERNADGTEHYTDSLVYTTDKTNKNSSCLDDPLISKTKSVLAGTEEFINHVASSTTPQDVSDHVSSLHLDFEERKLAARRPRPLHRSSENLLPIDESGPTSSGSSSKRLEHAPRRTGPLPLKRLLAESPPLCSICQHPSPVFGRPPRRFTYTELEFATGGFCKANFLAEGGYGSVHRGVLSDGIPVAVKQYKLASSQGDMEFCSEVEVLSCAQHRNVVMLIGYCIEKKRRLLVYEYICNGSLDFHLYGHNKHPLKWSPRHKIALGAARGLRYLHEECRVGCIVHRDMRPNNILLTHDFEPMVGDFGLARWQPDGDLAVETRVIGTFGYLAPEYTQTGQITEKADVYSFGVVLLELVSGRKAIDISQPRGQQCLTEWARPMLEVQAHHEMMDPRLGNDYNQYEAFCMLYAASLCTQRDPHLRPRMSQVLRMLEGDLTMSRNSSPMRSNSGRFSSPSPRSSVGRSTSPCARSVHFDASRIDVVASYMSAHPIVGCNTRLSHEALKAAYKDKMMPTVTG